MATISGGQKLAAALAKISKGVSQPAVLRVGFLAGSTYPNGTPVAMIAAIQDFGAPSRGIPPRPFFRNMVAKRKKEWPKAIADLLKANDYDAVKVLDIAGEQIEGQLRQSIIETNSPALKASTLKKRGVDPGTKYDPKNAATFGAKPLIHTGHMINSIKHEVKT